MQKTIATTRCRRQWEKEKAPENLQRIYRSLSNVDLEQERSKLEHNVNLPPLKRTESREDRLSRGKTTTTKGFDVKQMCALLDGRSSSKPRSAMADEEWIVMKPVRRKPKDLIKLEGPMDLSTTFRSSYDRAAKEIVNQLQQKCATSGGKQQQNGEIVVPEIDVSGKVVGSRKLPKYHRPKTSLKTGGECDYSTINRESFKRFIVIDANNNVKVPIGDVEQKQAHADILTLDPTLASPSSASILPKVKGANDSAIKSERRASKEFTQKESSRLKRDIAPEPSVDVGAEGDKVSAKGPIASGRAAGRRDSVGVAKSKDETAKSEAAQVNSETKEKQHNGIVNSDDRGELIAANHYPEANTEKRSEGLRDRKSLAIKGAKSDRSRHLSLPRPKITKHKNDSQLKFVGDMDFVTTSHSFYRDTTPIVGHNYAELRGKGAKRDLFRTSTEVDLFKRDKGAQFNPTTTYTSQFQDKLYCPAIDLDTTNSSYKFKLETGGHKFYYCRK